MAQAINLSPLALDAMVSMRRAEQKTWLQVTMDMFDAKPVGVVSISNKKAAANLVAMGLIKPVTYLGVQVAERYRVPKSIAFISVEPDLVDLEA